MMGLPDGGGELAVAVAVVAAVLAGLVRGFSGFGSALVLAPSLSAVYGPVVAVPVSLLLELALAVPFVPPAARLVDWSRIGVLAAAALVTVPVGAWLLATVSPELVRWTISAVVLSFVAILGLGWRYRGRPTVVTTASAGAVSGVLNGVAGLAGPPVIFYYLAGPDPAPRMRASFIVFFAWVDALAMAGFALTGTLTTDVAALALLLAIPYLAAAGAGARLFGRASEAFYRRLALVVLAAVAVVSLGF